MEIIVGIKEIYASIPIMKFLAKFAYSFQEDVIMFLKFFVYSFYAGFCVLKLKRIF